MIVPMRRVYLVVRKDDRDGLLGALRRRGLVHLSPVVPERAVAGDGTRRAAEAIGRALQVVEGISPSGVVPDLSPVAAAEDALDIQRRAAESRARLIALHRELEQLGTWGDLELRRIEDLRKAGIDVRFFSVPRESVALIAGECVADLAALPDRHRLVAVASRGGEPALPEGCVPVPLPERDAPSIRAEAAAIDAALKADAGRLAGIACMADRLRVERRRLLAQADLEAALRGATGSEDLFALRGWVPADVAGDLAEDLSRAGIPSVVRTLEPAPDEEPPTLIRRPRLVRPIDGLFRMLGTVAGYREFDVSVPFMIALPIFTAILISDGGYSAILLLFPLLFYRQSVRLLGEGFTQLLAVFGGVGLLWGLACGSFFGFVLYDAPVTVDIGERSRATLMHISFVIGAIHLSCGHLWQAARWYPDLRFLGKVGWALFAWGMFGVIRMVVLGTAFGRDTPWPYLLALGAALAVVFHRPSRNIVVTLGLGIANFPLSLLSAFSDGISYVRLMAVGLASSVLATSFNDLAMGMSNWPATVLVLVFGHGLNLGLALIALFAHGVRLNMLEFSGSLGMQWNGYPYRPFAEAIPQESDR